MPAVCGNLRHARRHLLGGRAGFQFRISFTRAAKSGRLAPAAGVVDPFPFCELPDNAT